MQEILFLLLPVAFYSGWQAAKKHYKTHTKKQKDTDTSFVRGINYLLNEEPDKALDVFLNYPSVDEYTAETFLLLGNLFRNRGEINRALRVHQHLIARPDLNREQRTKAMLALGEDFFSAGMLDRAESVFTEILKDDPERGDACEPLREIYEQLHEWDKAIEITQCAQQRNKTDKSRLIAHYYCELASQALLKKNLFLAEESVKKAIKVYPDSARILVIKAEIAFIKESKQSALQLYQQAIAQDSRLLGMLFKDLLTKFNQQDELTSLYIFVKQLFDDTKDNRLFTYLLHLAEELGKDSDLDQQIKQYLEQGGATLKTITHIAPHLEDQLNSNFVKALQQVSARQPEFQCTHCGYKMHDYLWRCPACHQWDTVSNV